MLRPCGPPVLKGHTHSTLRRLSRGCGDLASPNDPGCVQRHLLICVWGPRGRRVPPLSNFCETDAADIRKRSCSLFQTAGESAVSLSSGWRGQTCRMSTNSPDGGNPLSAIRTCGHLCSRFRVCSSKCSRIRRLSLLNVKPGQHWLLRIKMIVSACRVRAIKYRFFFHFKIDFKHFWRRKKIEKSGIMRVIENLFTPLFFFFGKTWPPLLGTTAPGTLTT